MREQIINLLDKKEIELKGKGEKLKEIHHETIQDWKKGKHRMNVEKVERALQANDLPEPFFWDGKIESFIEFSVKCAAKLGKKLTIKFE
jgi:hypothetical protein